MLDAAGGDLVEVFGHQLGGGVGDGLLLDISKIELPPSGGRKSAVVPVERFEVEVRCPAGQGGGAVRVDADELHLLGERWPRRRISPRG
jgi:hypothetical protein